MPRIVTQVCEGRLLERQESHKCAADGSCDPEASAVTEKRRKSCKERVAHRMENFISIPSHAHPFFIVIPNRPSHVSHPGYHPLHLCSPLLLSLLRQSHTLHTFPPFTHHFPPPPPLLLLLTPQLFAALFLLLLSPCRSISFCPPSFTPRRYSSPRPPSPCSPGVCGSDNEVRS